MRTLSEFTRYLSTASGGIAGLEEGINAKTRGEALKKGVRRGALMGTATGGIVGVGSAIANRKNGMKSALGLVTSKALGGTVEGTTGGLLGSQLGYSLKKKPTR
jgi:hypothetical protein